MKRLPLLFLLPLMCSCFSYRTHYNKSSRDLFLSTEKPIAYVMNQNEFRKEYKILKKSKLYALTQDSSTSVRIKLNKLQNGFPIGCATGQMTVMVVTFGQYPVEFPRTFRFSLEEIKNSNSSLIDFDVNIEKRVWFWDLFSTRKSLNQAIGRELRHLQLSTRK